MINEDRKKLYDALSSEYDLGTYEEFERNIGDSVKRKKLYDAASADYDLGDFESYSQRIGPTHKESLDAFTAEHGSWLNDFEARDSAETNMSKAGMNSGIYVPSESAITGEERKRYLELHKQEEALKKAWFTSDEYLAQKDADALFLSDARNGLNKQIMEYSQANPVLKPEGAFQINPYATRGAEADTELEKYRTASRILDDAIKMHNAPSKYDDKNVFLKFGKGSGDVLSDADFWTAGLTEIADNLGVRDVLSTVQEKRGNLNDLSEEAIENMLSPAEKAVLQAWVINTQEQLKRKDDLSRAYQAGQGATESLAFMAEFALTGGIGKAATEGVEQMAKWLGKKALTKVGGMTDDVAAKVLKETGEKIAQSTVGKYGVGLAESLAEAAGRTGVMPSTFRNISEKATEIETDENGNNYLVKMNDAFAKGYVDSFIENLSEGGRVNALGGLIGDVAGKIPAYKRMVDKFSHTKASELWDAFNSSGVMNTLRAGGWHGLGEEYLEEWYGNALRTLTGVDKEALKDFATVDNQIVTLTSFLPMTIFGGTVSTAQVLSANKDLEKKAEALKSALMERGYDEAQANNMIDMMRGAAPAEVSETLTPIVNSVANRNTNEAAALMKPVGEFAAAVQRWQSFNTKYNYQEQEQRDGLRTQMEETLGQFWQQDENGRQIVQRGVNEKGETVYMLGKPSAEDAEAGVTPKVAAVTSDGRKVFVNPSEYQLEDELEMNVFLGNEIMAEKGNKEQARMIEEKEAKIAAIREAAVPGTAINIGTAEAPVQVVVIQRNPDGVIVNTPDGQTRQMTYEEFGNYVGVNAVPMTDAQIDEQEADALAADRAQREAALDQEYDNDDAALEELAEAEDEIEQAVDSTIPLPMKADGSVDQNALWNENPERWAQWNDEQRKDGGANTLAYVSGAIAKEQAKIAELQAAYAAESDFDTRDAIEKQIADIQDRVGRLTAIQQGYVAQAEAAAAPVVEAEPVAPRVASQMSEQEKAAMDAQHQARLDAARSITAKREAMQNYVNEISQGSVPMTLISMDEYEQVMKDAGCTPNQIMQVKVGIMNAKRRGQTIPAFYVPRVGIFAFIENIPNIEQLRLTYVHERQHQFTAANNIYLNALSQLGLSRERMAEIVAALSDSHFYDNFDEYTLLDEVISYAMERAYTYEDFSVALQELGIEQEIIDIITEIDNEQRNEDSTYSSRRRGRSNLHDNSGRQGYRTENDRNPETVSGGILDEQGNRPLDDGSRRTGSTGEGAEVISDDDDASFRIVSEPEEEEPSSPFMAAAQQEGESIRFSITTEESLQEKIRKFAKTKDGKATKWSEDDIESIIAETESLIDAIHRSSTGNEFYDEFAYKEPTIRVDWRDGEAKPIVTWTRANIEYKYDMSADLLCINNEGLEEVLSSDKMVALMEMFIPEGKVKDGEPPIKFTAEDYLELYNTLRDLGFVVPCKGCFDAAGRFKMLPSVAQKFAAEVNAVIDERNKDPKAFDEKLRAKKGDKTVSGLPAKASTKSDAIEAGVAGDNLTEHVKWTQLMSADGQTKMLSDWGGIFRAWQRTGAGRPKDKLLPEPYYGDIVSSVSTIIGKYGEKTPSFRDTLVNQGTGLRRNSHSEFRPVLAIDEIQFMRDAFIRNLTVFKYMKELDDVRLFGKMGVKFNMSFFPEYVPGTKVAGLDKEGNYIASEESVGSREFPYQGEDGKRHYDGMKGWAEAQKYVNKDVSLSSVIFSIPHLLKALTDVPTPSDMRGIWGSLIPFHSSGATTASLAMQGLGMARANGVGHGFIEAFTDYGKGVTNFEAVQNDRFGEGWYIVSGKKAGTDVEPGHKLEFANGNHYYNRALGVHLFAPGYILDSELPEGVLGEKGELNITDDQKKALMHKFTIDYNDKVRELKGPYAYKAAADYYIAELPKLGLIPRFDFEVSEEKFLEMCEAANVDPRHPKLGWKGEGNSWSPIDSEAYYSLFCDYGMTDPATGEWAPHMPVGYVNEEGQREFRLPENAVEIVKSGLERFSEVRRSENARIDEAIEAFAERSVAKGRISQKNVDKVLGKKAASKKSAKSAPSGAIDLVAEAERVVAEQKQKEMQDGVALRVIGENETPREFLQKEVDAYRSRFNEVAPITLVDINSKSQMARVLGMQETDLTDEDMRDIREDIETKNKWGGYGFDSKEIAIFVREKVLDSKRLEMLMMHESIHALTARNKDFLWLGQYMWVNAKNDATLLGFRSQIAKKEPKNRWYDEMAAYVISLHMENGTISELESLLDAANRDRLNDLLNELGYDKESETAARDTAFVLRDNGYAEVGSEDSQKKGEEGKERVENEGASVSFRITPEQDKAYMDAVNAGDMETAQRMVIEAAKLAMPNTKVVDENGNPKVVYHGSTAMFTVFDKSRIGSATGTADGRGFYFTTDRDYALGYKTSDGQLFEVFLNIEKPLSYDKKTITKAQLRKILKEADRVEYEQEGEHYMLSNYANYNDVGIDAAVNEAANLEYDYADNDVELVGSLIGSSGSFDLIMDAVKKVTGKSGMIAPKDNGTIHYVVTDPAGIKSAEPVTYDNNGNVIPLSERFNPENEDIRFRVGIDNSKARDLFKDPETNQFFVDKNIDGFNRWLKEHAEDAVRLYHGTGESVDVANQGLLRTNNKRRRSYQSTPGYVYLSLYPSTAQLFGELAYPYESTKVYAVTVKIKDLKPDTDQLANKRYYDEDLAQMGNTLAESLIYASGARVKRNILPYEISEDIRFRVSNNNQAIFVSNAAKAVEGIKQEKATPEQWLKMIEKAGGLKAGEDKWMGLSDFLKSSDKKTLTKQEVLDFINENMIVIEETHYLQYAEEAAADSHREIVDKLQKKFNAYVAEYHEQNPDADEYADPAGEYAIEKLREEMEDTFPYTIEKVYGNEVYVTFDYEDMEEMEKWSEKLGVVYDPQYQINSTRLNYTTSGLDEKHEIALTVPTIESWNETDEVHFGEAGEGRAVAWIRFGETVKFQERYPKAEWDAVKKFEEENGAPSLWTDDLKSEYSRLLRAFYKAQNRKKVLVIDEIQSKRHQEGREKGYKPKDYWPLRTKYLTTKTVYDSFYGDMEGKYGEAFSEASTEEDFRKVMSESDFSQMLRIKGDFERASNAYIPYRNSVPDAPFDKNWHELAMKRMLRYAAENGYDVIAWTKGDQQAERYNIGGVLKEVDVADVSEGRFVYLSLNDGNIIKFIVDSEGNIIKGNSDYVGKRLSDIVGKELSLKILNAAHGATLSGEDLRIGGEGMRGFYDKMLPAFMNKYGKKWGVKVEDIYLPHLEDGLTMHSVPVTEEMKASVMEGQVMFRTTQNPMDAPLSVAEKAKINELFPDAFKESKEEVMLQGKMMSWLSDENLEAAKGKTREEIIELFGNTPEPISRLPKKYLGIFGETLDDNKIYSGKGYFIDHAVNGHPELQKDEYLLIQDVLNNPDDIKDVSQKGVKSVAFVKMLSKGYAVVIQLDKEGGKIVYHKSFFYRDKNKPYANKPDIRLSDSSEGGRSSIIRDGKPSHGSLLSARDEYLSDSKDNAILENDNDFNENIRYRVVTDQETLNRLNSEPTIKVYRAMQLIDGKLYPPMSAKVDGELRQPIELGQWEEAEERPDLVDEKGRFKLDKGNKSSLKARYNPYFHTSPTPLNDQFSSAQTRPELVTVEVEVPESELTSGYKAEKAKDSVGKMEWKAGVVQSKLSGTRTVILSRWDKPVRIVPDSEVADVIVDMFEGRDITVPSNVVTPSLRAELEKRGVPFVETDNQGNPVEEVSFRVTGTSTDEVVANGLQLTPAQTAEVAANIFAALPEESRKKITEGLNGNVLGLKDAILQIPASLASKENWNDEDKQMAAVVAEEMTKMAGEMTRPFSAEEGLWLLYNNLNKGADLISQASRALVQRNLGFDAETLAKQEQAKEDVRFRTVGDATSNAQASLYNRGAVNVWTRLKESFVDMQASVEELVKAVEERTGKVAQGFENILLALNQQSSKGLAAMESYTQKFLNPMFDEIRRIMDETKMKYEDVVRYVILKHGLERNKKLAQRDARAHYQEIYDDIISKITGMTAAQKRTYLTNAQLKEGDAKAELATLQAVDMSAMTDEEKREHKKKLAAARKAVEEAEEHLKRAQKIASLSEQEAQDELDKIFEKIENGTDSVYKEMRENDYSGISSMFYDQLGVDRKNFSTEEQYQAALMEAKKDRYSSLKDIEAAAEAEVKSFEGKTDTKELWKRINAATKETLRQQYEANMISKDQYDSLRNMFEYYVPLRGFKDNTAEDMYTYYRKPNSTGYTKPILGAEGRKTEAESPFGWIASMAGSAIASNVKNEAKLALYYFVSNRPENGIATISKTWFVDSGEVDERGKKIFKPAYPPFSEDLSSDAAKDAYEAWQENMRELQKKGQAYEAGQRLNLGNSVVNISDANKPEHIVNVKVGGKDYTIIINGNPRAAQAINGDLNIEGTAQDYSALFGPLLRWMSSVNTSYNPEFWITNMMRDMAFTMMAVNIKEDPAYRRKFKKNYLKAFKVVSLVAKNEKGTIGDSYLEQQYKDFVKYGGVTGYTQIKDSETWEHEIENYLSSSDPESIKSGKVMRGMKSAFHAAHRFGESLEQVSRFAAFLTARETGKSINEAINDAKEITVNFNRKGSGKMITLEEAKYLTGKNGQPLTKPQQWMVVGLSSIAPLGRRFIMFFNAAIQGLNATYKLMKKNPKRFTGWALGYAAVGMMNAVLHAMLDDDDDYLDIPQYERRNSLMIGGNGAYFKWALPQEARAFYALGDLAVETVMGRNPHQNFLGEALKIGTEVLPVNPSEGWKAFMPSVAIPFIELALNEDYKGAPIYNDQKWLSEEEKERTAKWSSAYQGTGWTYVKISQGLNFISGGDKHDAGLINLQPEKLEHLVQSAFGGTIRTADKFINTVSAAIDPEESVTIRQTPFLNRFLTINDERFKNVHVNDVFDYYKADAEHALTLEKQYIKDRDMDSLTELRSSDEYQWAKIYSKYKKPLKAIQDKIKVADGTAEKKELMKQQDELKKRIIKEISEL